MRFYKINTYHHKLKGLSQPPLHPLIYSHGFMLALGNSMDDIKAGIYGHKVIPLFHWMIFLSWGFHLSDMRRWTNSEFMMVSIYFIKSHFTLKMYDFNTWHKAKIYIGQVNKRFQHMAQGQCPCHIDITRFENF
jgi:hypothetical protein